MTRIIECQTLEEAAVTKSKRTRTLRKDLSENGPKEFRHIVRHDSRELLIDQQSNSAPNYEENIIYNIQRYFSGVDPTIQTPTKVKLPKVAITRSLSKNDISLPNNFVHVAHVDYNQVSRQIEEMSDFPRRSSTPSDIDCKQRKMIRKKDISEPRDFRQLAHIGFYDNQLMVETEDKTMKMTLDATIPSSSKLKNFDPRKSLADILQNSRERNKFEEDAITKRSISYPRDFQHIAHAGCSKCWFTTQEAFGKCIITKDMEIESFISDMSNDVSPLHQDTVSYKPIPKPRKFKKADIENPQDFRHNAHISHNIEKPLNLHDVILKHFFKRAGVTEEHLRDEDTRKFIFDFIRQYSKFDGKNFQKKPIPITYRSLAKSLQEEVERRSQQEFNDLLLASYRSHIPLPY